MKKAIINTWNLYLLLLLAINIDGCERCGDGPKGSPTIAPSPPETQTENKAHNTTHIDYAINLDEARKIKEQGNKIYYEVPLHTEVSIVAKTTGPPTVDIDWEQSLSCLLGTKMSVTKRQSTHYKSTRNGRVVAEDSAGETESVWVFASGIPTSVMVTGKPHHIGQAHEQGHNIINNEKVFVITWK